MREDWNAVDRRDVPRTVYQGNDVDARVEWPAEGRKVRLPRDATRSDDGTAVPFRLR